MSSVVVSAVSELQQLLTAEYGPFLQHHQVAEVLSVSPESLSNTMRRSREPNVVYLRLKKLRFGRRVRYSAIAVAEALALDHSEIKRRLQASDEGGSKRER